MSTKSLKTMIGIVILVLFTMSCGLIATGPTPTPTTDPATQAAATAGAQIEQTATAARATDSAKATGEAKAAIQSTANTIATADALSRMQAGATSTSVAKLTATQVSGETTGTAQAVARVTRTAEAVARITAQAQPMYDLVQGLVKDGVLSSGEGVNTRLPDFNEAIAQINYIFPIPTGYSPKNFVLKTDMAWDSASRTANWFNSACGFIFHIGEDGSYYSASLALDGNVYLDMHKPGSRYINTIGRWFYGKVEIPKGSAKFMLVVTEDQITVFINDKLVHSYKNELAYRTGLLAYSIISGTNKDYGTRCTLTNSDLWELK
jgi:hypothetical protein